MKIFLLLISLLAPVAPAWAQPPATTIRGKVTDEASKAPVPHATIVLLHTDPIIATTTDTDGTFTLDKVPVGRYDLQVSFVGYEPAIIKELTVSSSKANVVQVSIRESVAMMSEVVVKPKVNKAEPLNPMATVSARMLSVEEASRYAGGFDDPARLASSFAGVASNVANNGIVVRGNAPKFLQWRMEGVEIPNPNHFADLSAFGGGGLTALSSQMLANSDFFTGAFPAEYSNALSGVFDIFMRTGNNQQHEHTLQAGIIGIDAASEGPFKKGGKSSYLFNYRYSTLALVQPLLPEEAQGTSYQDVSFKLNFPTKKAGTFAVWGIGLLDRSGQVAEKDSTRWLYRQHREEADARQHMGATGISHDYFPDNNTQLKTTLAATTSALDWNTKRLNKQLELQPQNQVENRYTNIVLSSSLNKKFNARHTNKTGITLTGLLYDLHLQDAGKTAAAPVTLADETGFSSLLSAYTSSTYHFSNRLTLTMGVNGQLFTLNKRYTIEPRAGLKWQLSEAQHLGFAYGLHSRLERLNYYFTKAAPGTEATGNGLPNKNLDFTKAHHFVFSYGISLTENLQLKAEPYYQHLFRVPVVPGGTFSFINLQNEWFFPDRLSNSGQGRNYGLDLTLERYLSQGYYYLVTTSLFNSEYKAGDGHWRNTMFNRRYLVNLLSGKEWHTGSNKQNVLGLNFRLTFQGGDRYTPVNVPASLLVRHVVYDEQNAYTKQIPPSFLAHFTASYKINRPKRSHEFALKILNATSYSDFYGFRYNAVNKTIDEHREAIMIPNLSYRVEF